MARSTNIYVVMANGRPEAAFTVKHELVTHLGKRDPIRPPYTIYRLRDGGKQPELTEIIEL